MLTQGFVSNLVEQLADRMLQRSGGDQTSKNLLQCLLFFSLYLHQHLKGNVADQVEEDWPLWLHQALAVLEVDHVGQ